MKILGISGSPRKGATEYAVKEALETIRAAYPEIEVEYMSLRGKKLAPCTHCDYCKRKKDWCVIKDDGNDLVKQMTQADAFIIGSPVYVMEPCPQMMAFFSRMRPIHHVFPGALRNKLGVSLAVGGARNGGQELTVNALNNMMLSRGINVVSNEVFGYHGGKVWSRDGGGAGAEADEIGMKTVRELALKLAENLVVFDAGRKALAEKDSK